MEQTMSSESEYSVSAANVDHATGASLSAVGMSVRNKESYFLPADELKGYEMVVPGSAERLFSIMEKQAYHRMELETKTVDRYFEGRNSHFGLGILALLLFAGLSVFFAFMGMEWAAVTAVGCPALYGLSSFLTLRKGRVDGDLP
jgi:uncharacterized membrane protein